MDGWNTTFLLGRPIFRGYVSFREGTYIYMNSWFLWDHFSRQNIPYLRSSHENLPSLGHTSHQQTLTASACVSKFKKANLRPCDPMDGWGEPWVTLVGRVVVGLMMFGDDLLRLVDLEPKNLCWEIENWKVTLDVNRYHFVYCQPFSKMFVGGQRCKPCEISPGVIPNSPGTCPGTFPEPVVRNLPGTRGSEAAPAPPRNLYWQRPHS